MVVGTYPSEPIPALKIVSTSTSGFRAFSYFSDQLSFLLEAVPQKEQAKMLIK